MVLCSAYTSPIPHVGDEVLYLKTCVASAILCLFLFQNLSDSILPMSLLTKILLFFSKLILVFQATVLKHLQLCYQSYNL